MAEKKRKRLLAQQESKKNITPIVFEDRPGKILEEVVLYESIHLFGCSVYFKI